MISCGSQIGGSCKVSLTGLLSTPLEGHQILGAKWLGSVLRLRHLAYVLGALWLLALLSGAMHPLAVAELLAAFAAHVAFLASLGLWVSLVSRNTLWAHFTMALMLLMFFGTGWMTMLYSSPGEEPGLVAAGLNPLRTWWVLGFSWREFALGLDDPRGRFAKGLAVTLGGQVAFAAGAGLFWWVACRRFRREGAEGGR